MAKINKPPVPPSTGGADEGWEDMSNRDRIPFLEREVGKTYHKSIIGTYQFPSGVPREQAEWATYIVLDDVTDEQHLLPTDVGLQRQIPTDATAYEYRLTYNGKNKIAEGANKGKMAHSWKVKAKHK